MIGWTIVICAVAGSIIGFLMSLIFNNGAAVGIHLLVALETVPYFVLLGILIGVARSQRSKRSK
jgi:ABC-type uncharacterized transport system permease subunit